MTKIDRSDGKAGSPPKSLPIKVVGNACNEDANAEDASPECRGAGDNKHPRRSHQSKQDSSRLLDLLPGSSHDHLSLHERPGRWVHARSVTRPDLTDAIAIRRPAGALIGGIASQFGWHWPKGAAGTSASERVERTAPRPAVDGCK